jgi:hypothetical protein
LRTLFRTLLVVGLAAGLIAVFLRNADLPRVWTAMRTARPDLVALSIVLTGVSYVVRAERWQYLLAPLGKPRYSSVFRTTVIGFAASAVLPARAGEVLRPYLLARREGLSATAAFATIVIERVLDVIGVLLLLGAYLVMFDPGSAARSSMLFEATRAGGLTMAALSVVALAGMFVLAGHPDRLHAGVMKAERVLPSRLASLGARLARAFAEGLAALRRPERLIAALAWSIALWVAIAGGIWAVTAAFGIPMSPFGAWLLLAPLVVGVAVPTPGGIGGFHEAYRMSATAFFGADNDAAVAAAIVLHAVSFGPVVLAGFWFALQDGLRLGRIGQLAAPGVSAARAAARWGGRGDAT